MCLQKLIRQKEEKNPELQVNHLVPTANLKKTLPKGDSTDWSYKLWKITEIINDTILSYRIDNLSYR